MYGLGAPPRIHKSFVLLSSRGRFFGWKIYAQKDSPLPISELINRQAQSKRLLLFFFVSLPVRLSSGFLFLVFEVSA
jgi:hypothetical protein